jgi:hypothetical protein
MAAGSVLRSLGWLALVGALGCTKVSPLEEGQPSVQGSARGAAGTLADNLVPDDRGLRAGPGRAAPFGRAATSRSGRSSCATSKR